MNIANILTVARVALVPIFLVFLLVDSIQNFMIALIIFSIAALTDFLDGYIARKYNMITKFGKLIDPLADKLLTVSAFIALTCLKLINPWIVIVIISREFIITGFRSLAAAEGKVIAASYFGKLKTVCQITTIITILLSQYWGFIDKLYLVDIFSWITLVITVLSATDYIAKNIDVVKNIN